jgi:hypothetical protein
MAQVKKQIDDLTARIENLSGNVDSVTNSVGKLASSIGKLTYTVSSVLDKVDVVDKMADRRRPVRHQPRVHNDKSHVTRTGIGAGTQGHSANCPTARGRGTGQWPRRED